MFSSSINGEKKRAVIYYIYFTLALDLCLTSNLYIATLTLQSLLNLFFLVTPKLLAHLAFPPLWLTRDGRLRLLKRLMYLNHHHSRGSWFLLTRHYRHPAAFVGETRKSHTIVNLELY